MPQVAKLHSYSAAFYSMKHVTVKAERDKLVVESVVRRFGPVSRSGVHEFTDLQQSDISRLVRELLEEKRLIEAGRADNPLGRKQVLLRFNEDHRFIAGIGFDDESVLASVMNLHPSIRTEVRETTVVNRGIDGLVQQLVSCTRKALQQAGVSGEALVGIGLAGSGLVDSRRGIFLMSSTVDFFQDVPLQRIFEDEFGAPTVLENLTRAKTVGERQLGAGGMAEDMLFVEYGRTGIGAGVVLNGQLVHGAGFAAGEFGHTHMTGDGPACKCGSFGCLETVAGAAALQTRMRKAIAEGGASEALALANGDPQHITGWMVLEAAHKGDKTSVALVEQMGTYLGLGLANLVNLFNPSVLVIDQRLSLAGEGMLDLLRRIVNRQALRHATRDLAIHFGKLGNEAILLGVGSIVLQKHFEIPALKLPRFMLETATLKTAVKNSSRQPSPVLSERGRNSQELSGAPR
jgi:predicted NBD/HSP70 family sugar kinase